MKIPGFDQLRQYFAAVVRRIGRIIGDVAVFFNQTDKTRVLHPVAFVLRHGENDPFRDQLPVREKNLVIRFRQPLDVGDGAVHVGGGEGAFGADGVDGPAHFLRGETGRQAAEDRSGRFTELFHLLQLGLKKPPVVGRVQHDLGCAQERADRLQEDRIVTVDQGAAEDDRGDMPFAGGAKAEDHAGLSLLEVVLLGIDDDRRIEKGGGFNGVFHGETGTEQQLSFLGQGGRLGDAGADPLVIPHQHGADVLMAVGKLLERLLELGLDKGFVQRQDAMDDRGDVALRSGAERTGNDPARVGADIFQGPVRNALEQARNYDRVREGGLAQLLMGDQDLGFDINGFFFGNAILRFFSHAWVY